LIMTSRLRRRGQTYVNAKARFHQRFWFSSSPITWCESCTTRLDWDHPPLTNLRIEETRATCMDSMTIGCNFLEAEAYQRPPRPTNAGLVLTFHQKRESAL